MYSHILVDGDVITYRAAWSEQEGSEEDALLKVDELLSYVWLATDPWGTCTQKIYLTGKGNFRFDIAKTAVYKGNRKDTEKPKHYKAIRDHLITTYNAEVTSGEEADDAIAMDANFFGYDNTLIVSIDKDFHQIPTNIYDPTKDQFYKITPWQGLVNFYTQILVGDRVDNIVGLWRVGPVKAAAIFAGCDSEKSLYNACVDAFDGNVDRVVENGRLSWLRRKIGEMWEPPK